MVAANNASVVPTRDAIERLCCPSTATAAGEIFDRRDVKRCDGVNVAVSIDHRDGVLPHRDEFWMWHFEFAAVGSADDEGLKTADHSLTDQVEVHVENVELEIPRVNVIITLE